MLQMFQFYVALFSAAAAGTGFDFDLANARNEPAEFYGPATDAVGFDPANMYATIKLMGQCKSVWIKHPVLPAFPNQQMAFSWKKSRNYNHLN